MYEKHYLQWVPQWSIVTTIRVVEHVELLISETNTPSRNEFLLALMKKIVILVLPSTFIDML